MQRGDNDRREKEVARTVVDRTKCKILPDSISAHHCCLFSLSLLITLFCLSARPEQQEKQSCSTDIETMCSVRHEFIRNGNSCISLQQKTNDEDVTFAGFCTKQAGRSISAAPRCLIDDGMLRQIWLSSESCCGKLLNVWVELCRELHEVTKLREPIKMIRGNVSICWIAWS